MEKENDINREIINHLSFLSRIKLDEDEVEKMIEDLKMIKSYIDEVLSIEVEDEGEIYLTTGRLREDEVTNQMINPADFIKPEFIEDGYIKGPKVSK
ncbi:MAG: Asp-tRNA(Asn)/Glu-tRNA(Gln) amidotransferase subunit GatC [Fervidicoccus sp.]